MVTTSAPGRVRHVLLSYLPMIFLGFLLLALGMGRPQPHIGRIQFGNLLLFLGVFMLVGALIGMLFTRCEKDYVRWRIFCYEEPDVRADRGGQYYRELVPEEPPAE